MKRLSALLMILPALLTLLSACDPKTGQKKSPETRTDVTFLHYFTDSLGGGFYDIAQAFNTKNKRYTLRSIPLDHESFKTSIRTTLEAGNPPDLYSYWAGARTESVIEHLEPLDDFWQQNDLDKRFPPSITKAASEYNGRKYFIPMTQHYIGFFYNKKLFEKNGMKPPATWNEFLAVCEGFKRAGIPPIALGAREKWPAQFWFDLLLLRTVPYEFRQKLMQGEAGYQDARVTEVFKRWAHLHKSGYFYGKPNELSWDSGASELVYTGKAAMTLMGTWVIGYYSNASHKWAAGKDFDFFPFPAIDEKIPTVSLGPIDGLILPKKAVNKEGAKSVMLFLTENEPQQAISRGAGALAPSLAVPGSAYTDIQKRIISEISKSRIFAFAYDLATPPAVADLGLNAFSEFIEFPDAFPDIQKRLATDAAAAFRELKSPRK